MIIWKKINGTTITIDKNTDLLVIRDVLMDAKKTMKGQYPSINSKQTIRELVDFVRNELQNE